MNKKNVKKFLAPFIAAVIISNIGSSVAMADNIKKTNISVNTVNSIKISNKSIKLTFNDTNDKFVKSYSLQKYDKSNKKWKTIKTFKSNGKIDSKDYSYTDNLSKNAPQQYKYRVNITVADKYKNTYQAITGKTNYGSNIKVCIDPGHFQKSNKGTYNYTEAEAVLQVGLSMKKYLKSQGIDVYMTRSNSDIKVGGITNKDNGNQLSARGHSAKKNNCDLFVSLHTNANMLNANGYDTIHQPKSINKTVVFVNKKAYNESNKCTMKIADNMGNAITNANKKLGIATNNWCNLCKCKNKPIFYNTDSVYNKYNDSLKKEGAVIYRQGNWAAVDYYAVLRAVSSDNLPGILIEHSYHTNPDFCYKFMSNSKVSKTYGYENAKAIAKGYGFETINM